MIPLSEAAAYIVQSEIRIMSVECEKVGGVNLAQGVCDTEAPLPVRKGAQTAIDAGFNSYTRLEGIPELRAAIARKMWDYNRIKADPEREVIVTVGSTGGFYCACLALLNPGDEVVVFEPFYGYHVLTLRAVKAVPAYVTLRAPDWSFAPEDLQRAIGPRTRAIVVNSPANPSGKVFNRQEMTWIAECAIRHDLIVFTDEIYEYFVYDGRQHISLASLPGMAQRTVTLSGFSKTFSITGWRIGYAICSQPWAAAIGYFHDLIYVCAPAPLQHGIASGMSELTPEFYFELMREYSTKRDLICHSLQQAGLIPCVPQGSYYVLADASRLLGNTSKQKAMHLLAEIGVASVPGEAFFHDGSGRDLLRFCFAKTTSDLQDASQRLARAQCATATRSPR